MRMMAIAGWIMIAVGVGLGVGGFVIGMPIVGIATAAGLIFGGWLNLYLGAGWDTPLDDASELYKYGRPANAEVLSVDETVLSPAGTRTAKVAVRIAPVNESAFKSTRTVALPGGSVPAVGSSITVKFDPNSRKNFVLLEENIAVKDHVTASAEALFGGLKA